MPVYGFKCQKCGEKFNLLLSFSQKDKAICPRCQSKELQEYFSGYGSARANSSQTQSKFT